MKKIVCKKCNWFYYNPDLKCDTKCIVCGHPFNYKTDIIDDDVQSLPVDWSKRKD